MSETVANTDGAASRHESDALTAASRIRADLRQLGTARLLGGETGDLHVWHTVPARARTVFDAFGRLDHVLGTGGAGDAPGTTGTGRTAGFRSEGSMIVNAGREYLSGTVTDHDKPAYLTLAWRWQRWGSGATRRAQLPRPSGLRVDLAESRLQGSVRTTIDLHHTELPVEWLDDMRAFWTWTLHDLPNRWRL